MATSFNPALASRRLANGVVLRVVSGAEPGDAKARMSGGDIAVAVRMVGVGLLVAAGICVVLIAGYALKTALGVDLTPEISPIHLFLDNLRQTDLL